MGKLEILKLIRDGCKTVPELMEASKLGAQNVRAHLMNLKKDGWITSKPQPSRGRGNPGKIYEFNQGGAGK